MRKLITSLLLAILPLLIWSQVLIKGKITDPETQESLIGVNVVIFNSSHGTVTDVNGDYTLEIPESEGNNIELEVSYIGYASQVIEVQNTNEEITKNISLEADAHQLKDVIVSANKRTQSSQLVPMSITTLTPLQLRRTGAQEFRDYASGIPNLSFGTQGAGNYGRYDNGISIRGIAGANTTSMYLDETPMPENIDPRLIDVAGVEVLKGPQGTLYGSRSMGGAVKVITNKPNVKQLEGSIETNFAKVKEGDMDYGVQGVLNIPLSDKLAFRGAGYYDLESGIFDRKINRNANIMNLGSSMETELPDGSVFNIATDNCPGCNLSDIENIDKETNYGFHASLGYYPTDKISIIPKVIIQRQKGDGLDFAEGAVDNFEQIRVSGVPETYEDSWNHYSLTSEFDLTIGKIISSTSFLDRKILEIDDDGESFSRLFEIYDGEENLDFFSGNISKDINVSQFNQEIRFQSELGGKFDFTIGAFYMKEDHHEEWLSNSLGIGSYASIYYYEDPEWASYIEEEAPAYYEFGGDYLNEEVAFFGEAYFSFLDKWKATFGLRYFDAKLGIDAYETGFIVDTEYFEIIDQVSEKGFNPKFNLIYQMDKNKLFYASIGKGYRLGDLNEIVPEVYCSEDLEDLPNSTHPRTYESDYLWTYELGFKGTWANGKLVTNAALFFNDWSNLQQNRTLECGYSFVSNVGSASTKGFELEIKTKASKNLEISAGLGVVDATINEGGPNLDAEAGDRMLFTPDVTGNVSAQYSAKLNTNSTWYVLANVQHVGERLNTFSPEDIEEAHRVFDPYTILNTRIGIQFPKTEFALFINNLTNTHANYGDIFSLAVDVPGRHRYATNRPVTIGVQGRYYF